MSLTIPRGLSFGRVKAILDEIGKEKLKLERLKFWQRDGAAKLLSGNDVLVLAETGGGKSIIFWLYASARPDEIILVISPLKMLERNMVS